MTITQTIPILDHCRNDLKRKWPCSGILCCEEDVQKVVHKKVKPQMENS